MKKLVYLLLAVFTFAIVLSGCSESSAPQYPPEKTFTILAGSEDQPFEPLLQKYADSKGYHLQMVYKGSIDSMQELSNNPSKYDAIWLPNSMWIKMGDTHKVVKDDKSIFTSPVAFGIKKSKAEELGFVGKDVTVNDILQAVENHKLSFMMTSASQSNSGASAYIGFLYALLGNPEVITKDNLQDPKLKQQVTTLLSGINRSSGSSGFLKDLYLNGNYDAMVNYEAVLIETNQQLVKQGKEPLYVVYPKNGLTIADNVLGYIDNKDTKKETFFQSLQNYLLSDSTQKQIADTGRRTGFGGTMKNANPNVFNPDWGIQTDKPLVPIRFPSEDVIRDALTMYQTEFKKPSYTVFAIDFSGSMGSNGGEQGVKQAMSLLLDQNQAKNYLLQSTNEDKVVVIPFSSQPLAKWEADDLSQYGNLLSAIKKFTPDGGTDIFTPVMTGLNILSKVDTNKYTTAVILMTDGESNEGRTFDDLKNYYQKLNKDIPVFTIAFGDADTSPDSQLNKISNLTRGKFFDGKNDLVGAFKNAKGYN